MGEPLESRSLVSSEVSDTKRHGMLPLPEVPKFYRALGGCTTKHSGVIGSGFAGPVAGAAPAAGRSPAEPGARRAGPRGPGPAPGAPAQRRLAAPPRWYGSARADPGT